ncbi:MAG: nicotinate (nicotinamide) nucleotide adenylyltransferase [Sedimentisphaerales bacterium]|nr:nicotinate (nicotinamide) nucleotide adenylyltransferase [Sedimentisphaerales bacterium]
MSTAQRTIALFGGTFDPIHLGHAGVAQAAAAQIGAEAVLFIPARCSPLKGFLPHASDADRLAMIALAISGRRDFAVSDRELKRPAPSYTLDTVRQYQREYGPQTAIHWLLGADSIGDLAHWHKIRELIDECNLTTMQRAGYEPPDFDRFAPTWGPERVAKLRRHVVQTPLIDISSTEVRRRLTAGEDVRGMLHPDVIDYIRRHDLYWRTDA